VTRGSSGGTREPLTRARVVAAALAIVDRDGLDGLTMRALGRELGVDPMAAYHWFPNKLAILQGVSEAILAEIVIPPMEPARGWRETGAGMAREYRAAMLRHPNALPVASTQPILTPRGLELLEEIVGQLVSCGLSPGAAMEAVNTIAAFVIGSCVVQAGVSPGSEPLSSDAVMEVYAGIDTERFPTLAASMAESAEAMADDDTQFETGTDALLRGLDLSLRERGLLRD
jgi:TetR/AcrR family transcriptional regulator, tetracycline repressor protein